MYLSFAVTAATGLGAPLEDAPPLDVGTGVPDEDDVDPLDPEGGLGLSSPGSDSSGVTLD
jgi:hypothetical protein